MTAGDANEAEMMTSMITGFIYAAMHNLKDVLTPPVVWHECDPKGVIKFRLASGMPVIIGIQVDPVIEPAPESEIDIEVREYEAWKKRNPVSDDEVP